MNLSQNYLKELTYLVNGAAIEVHKTLDPGLLESVYQKCMEQELMLRGIQFQAQAIVPLNYKGIYLDVDLRCDLLIEKVFVVELKAVEKVLPVHEAQLLTYMQLLGLPKGLLINFNVSNIYHEGQKTYVNSLFRSLPE
jgi:GxxExxY protein